MNAKASEVIRWVKSKVGFGYVYGATGQVCTVNFLKSVQSMYGKAMGEGYFQTKGDYTKSRCSKWLGKIVLDCSGLLKAARKSLTGVWKDVSAQGTYDQCSDKRGKISNMQLIPGTLVFMYGKTQGRMVHVGIYIGDGNVVESRGADYGVVITKLSTRAWTHWGQVDWIDYDIKADSGKAVAGNEADSGDNSSVKPDDVQSTDFNKALSNLVTRYGISKEYWATKKDIDPYFDDLIIKIGK